LRIQASPSIFDWCSRGTEDEKRRVIHSRRLGVRSTVLR